VDRIPLLEVRGVYKNFGAFQVTSDVNLTLLPGARHALIGPNGAGKTTLVNLLTGAIAVDRGCIMLSGRDVTRQSEAGRVKAGLVRTFQVNQLFTSLTVLENVLIALAEHLRFAWRPLSSLWRHRDAFDEALAILRQVRLEGLAKRRVDELAYGQQRLLELAVALSMKPHVLLLDEPAAGVPQGDSGIILEVIESLPIDIAVLMIEHDMELVRRFAKEITVLVRGSTFFEGSPEAVSAHKGVGEIYLGEEANG
jgi:branched-chain amino acid transport system ATP-binding protein